MSNIDRYLKKNKETHEHKYEAISIYGVEWKIRKLTMKELRKASEIASKNGKFSHEDYNDAMIVLATEDHFPWKDLVSEYSAKNKYMLPVVVFEYEPETYSVLLEKVYELNQTTVQEMEMEIVSELKK